MTDPHDPAHEPQVEAMPHGAAHDVDVHGEEDHDSTTLGPVDVEAWLAAALGVALGLIVALCLVIAVSL
jgi:hypothetical protein